MRPAAELNLDRLERPAWIAAIAGIVFSLVGAWFAAGQFFRSYLLAYLFWFAIALGALPLVMIHHLVGGRWGFVTRRILESATRTLPLMAVLFVPILLGIHHLYEWSHPDAAAHDSVLAHKSPYLNTPFFIARTVFYFAVWLIFAWILNRWSDRQDATGDPSLIRRFQLLSGPGVVLYALTITFASIDWVMSLEPHWFSTIYGLIFMVGQVLSTLAFGIVILALIADAPPMPKFLRPETLQDLGNLLFACVMLWAYLSFSQYLIIWSGNLPEDIPWYVRRSVGGWQWVAAVLALFHFAIPFLLLLVRRNKQKRKVVAAIAAAVILMRSVDLAWLIMPSYEAAVRIHWLDLATLAGVGGLWVAVFCRQLRKQPLLPLQDPEFRVGNA